MLMSNKGLTFWLSQTPTGNRKEKPQPKRTMSKYLKGHFTVKIISETANKYLFFNPRFIDFEIQNTM